MTTVIIEGISVKFPFTPYEIQKNYMRQVIKCLEEKQNGVLESPTGTGKTLSLLCASLAWLEAEKAQINKKEPMEWESDDDDGLFEKVERKAPTIIYASRTHTQLYQAMQEMKRTEYRHMKACVLGSRVQMCIDPEILEERENSVKINLCKAKVTKRRCMYHNRVEKQVDNPAVREKSIIDMEDIVKLGKCNDFCPYFMARELKAHADVVFMPYNYLLDFKTRKDEVGFMNCVVILDEAHNIEKVCEEAASTQISSADLKQGIVDVTAIIEALVGNTIPHNEELLFTLVELRQLQQILINLEYNLKHIHLTNAGQAGTYFDGDYMFELLQKAGLPKTDLKSTLDLLEILSKFLANTSTPALPKSSYCLDIISHFLAILSFSSSPDYQQKIRECFKVHITEEMVKKFGTDRLSQSTKESIRVLSFWCFSPGFAMKMLLQQDIHCLILTSGTLAPLKPLISELEIDVSNRIENPHIVKSDQVCVTILSKGPDQELLNGKFENRDNPKYLRSLGMSISNLVRVIPHGVLIFFPSYYIMEKCQEFWSSSGIWNGINSTKPVFVEPKDKSSFTTAMEDYYAKIQDPKYNGAIFMGVCRGKVSEGLDFVDINGRAVLIIGLPYPPLKDPKVILKRQYLDHRNSQNREHLRGQEWYSLEATRAINQAIGRVIRHQHDYGAIILMDSRFSGTAIKSNMSAWLQEHLNEQTNYGMVIRNLRAFFEHAQLTLPPPKPRGNLLKIDADELLSDATNYGPDYHVKIHRRGKRKAENAHKRPRKCDY